MINIAQIIHQHTMSYIEFKQNNVLGQKHHLQRFSEMQLRGK
jgi:hypothetical protein